MVVRSGKYCTLGLAVGMFFLAPPPVERHRAALPLALGPHRIAAKDVSLLLSPLHLISGARLGIYIRTDRQTSSEDKTMASAASSSQRNPAALAQEYQSRRQDLQGLAQKLGELEADADEHR